MVRCAEEGQRGKQAARLDVLVTFDWQVDGRADDIQPFVTYQHLGAAVGIGGGTDLVRRATVVSDQLNPGSRFAIYQHPHGQRLAGADLEWIDFRQDNHLQLIQLRQLGAFLVNRQAVLERVQ